jgi:anthranilate phosphoribosyltransferase
MEFTVALQRALGRESLDSDEAQSLMERILRGEASAAWIAGWLVALRAKGESAGEIAGFVRALRTHAAPLDLEAEHLVDTCGTGGDASGTFNISTVAALAAAGAGARVAKHGNRSVSSRCGSADLLEALGVELELAPAVVTRALEEIGFGFLFAPQYHAALRHAAEPRRALGVRTVFNMLGPLVNPAGAPTQVLGVYDRALLPVYGEALLASGCQRALIVHGEDGLDELSVCAPTRILHLSRGRLTPERLDPSQWGLGPHPTDSLAGGDIARNAEIALGILRGEGGPRRDVVLLNAAAALMACGRVSAWEDGLEAAAESIDSGRALAALESYAELSRTSGRDG